MEKKKIKVIGIGICVLAVLGTGCWTCFNIAALMETRREWIQKAHELVKAKNEVAQIERLLNFYKKEKSEFQEYLFQEKDIPGFLDGLAGFAQNAGISIVDMKTNKFQEVKVPEAMKESQSELAKRRAERSDEPLSKNEMNRMLTLAALPINFKIQGTYQAVIEFYRYLENFKQLISISNVEIASTTKYPALECAFTLKIYSLKTLEELKGNR